MTSENNEPKVMREVLRHMTMLLDVVGAPHSPDFHKSFYEDRDAFFRVAWAARTLLYVRGYTGFEAEPCPLCTYEGGVFKEACGMHNVQAQLHEYIETLEAAIREHRDQKGHDRCWLDDDKLYSILPEGHESADRSLPPKDEFLEGCSRFHDLRAKGISYDHCSLPEVLTNAEAERRNADALAECLDVVLRIDDDPYCTVHGEHYCRCEDNQQRFSENKRIREKAKATLRAHAQRRQ